ncbi:MAG: SH3 domain-containing protein [Alphaproteobacteria bacterium]|nr:SH3 domain-containing protein [Alphaproteobacteria bacterium]
MTRRCPTVPNRARLSPFSALAAPLVALALLGSAPAVAQDAEAAPAVQATGPSGLPLPRFVSLKSSSVNMRSGPGTDYPISWTYQRRGWPVEITAEFEHWRKVRDRDGEEGWIHKDLLQGRRMAVTTEYALLMRRPEPEAVPVARLEAGVLARLERCEGAWCRISTERYDGWIERSMIYGVYPDEAVE